MSITYRAKRLHKGDQFAAWAMLVQAWTDYPELRVQPLMEWGVPLTLSITQMDRTEIVAYDGELRVAHLVLAVGEGDIHVGKTLDVILNYTIPEYRNRYIGARLYRMAIAEAKFLNRPVLAYTHRVGDWQYKTTYRKING